MIVRALTEHEINRLQKVGLKRRLSLILAMRVKFECKAVSPAQDHATKRSVMHTANPRNYLKASQVELHKGCNNTSNCFVSLHVEVSNNVLYLLVENKVIHHYEIQ